MMVGPGSPLPQQQVNQAPSAPPAQDMNDAPKKLLKAVGHVAKGVHWSAEELISAAGLNPLFALVDKPIVHALLWKPIARITGVSVDEHPPGVD